MEQSKKDQSAEIARKAAQLPLSDRLAFIENACGQDKALVTTVLEQMRLETSTSVTNDEDATDLCVTKTGEPGSLAAISASNGDDERVGPYRLIKPLGEGGMGTVFLAMQEKPIRRHVALKLIKLGMDSDHVLRRFEMERQTLSKLKHPYIAQVYDAGTSDRGQPYFVMEYVEGAVISEYCDTHHLTVKERLHLFCKVCDALQHAHQKGIIHRDIKPTNILVVDQDGTPIPKVIDFGIAKAIAGEDTETRTAGIDLTRPDVVIGTLGYMSPEQCRISDEEVDTRTDVYSLGILLYELLVGRLPIEADHFRKAAWDEMFRVIREEIPPKPSSKILTLGDDAVEVADHRQTEIHRLKRQLAGDLDWIIMKALEKEKGRRYASPNEFSADLKRHLSHLPVQAGPPSRLYLAKKFVRRNKLAVAASLLVVASLIVGIAGTSLGFLRASKKAKTAQETVEVLREFLTSPDPNRFGKDVTMVDMLKRFEPRLADFADKPVIQGILYATFASTYLELGFFDQALHCGENALLIHQSLYGKNHIETIRVWTHFCRVLMRMGRLTEAEKALEEVCTRAEQTLGTNHQDTLSARDGLGVLFLMQGKYDQAEAVFEDVLPKMREQFGDSHEFTLNSMGNLMTAYSVTGQIEKATQLCKRELEILERTHGEDHPLMMSTQNNLAYLLLTQGSYAEAEMLFRRVFEKAKANLGIKHPNTVTTLNNLAICVFRQDREEEGIQMIRQVLGLYRETLDDNHPDLITTLSGLGVMLNDMGKLDEAQPLLREAVEKSQAVLGLDHEDTLSAMTALAQNIGMQGEFDRAEALFLTVLERFRLLKREHVPTFIHAQAAYADMLRQAKRYSESKNLFHAAIQNSDENQGERHPSTIHMLESYHSLLIEMEEFGEAQRIQSRLDEIDGDAH